MSIATFIFARGGSKGISNKTCHGLVPVEHLDLVLHGGPGRGHGLNSRRRRRGRLFLLLPRRQLGPALCILCGGEGACTKWVAAFGS